jgi:hypothetical protein
MIASASVPFHSASLYVGDLAADASEVRCAYLDVISVFRRACSLRSSTQLALLHPFVFVAMQ